MTALPESAVVWNVIFVPHTFRFLQVFARSLVVQSDARFRLVANSCASDDVAEMCAFAARFGGRVDVVSIGDPGGEVVRHGAALTELFDRFDDGELFCFVDSDVEAKAPFVQRLLDALDGQVAVTSGDVAWTDDTTLPAGAPDLAGRHVVDRDGFVYGSSFLGVYRRAAVERTRDEWDITFEPYAYDRLPERARSALSAMNRRFRLYDTAKTLNLLLQHDGPAIRHIEHPALFHLGGISQFLAQRAGGLPAFSAGDAAARARWDFARWAAATLAALVDGSEPPAPPDDGVDAQRASLVLGELRALVSADRE